MSAKIIIYSFIIYSLLLVTCQSQELWTSTSTINAPSVRSWHTAVWTGSKMIIWGGVNGSSALNTGGIYNSATDSWTTISNINAPTARYGHTAVWTGTKMIVWGGWNDSTHPPFLNTGGIYDPVSNSWSSTTLSSSPLPRYWHTAIWTGSKMIIWGGFGPEGEMNTGGIYDPAIDSWIGISTTGAPSPRMNHTAVWTGSKMIVWGGYFESMGYFNTGGIYNPVTNMWLATSTENAPSVREWHSSIWTGNLMVVWGGWDGSDHLNSGGIYNLLTNSWTDIYMSFVPSARCAHSVIWTGSKMVVWGGSGYPLFLNTGGIHNPLINNWTIITTNNAPLARCSHTAVWTGSKMIVWGGLGPEGELNTGGIYGNPSLTDIQPINGSIPSEFFLSQNYPNPFNPTTKIKFDIPPNVKRETANVKIIIYDVLGREVATLVNEQLKPGSYEVEWDGSNYPSGVYFYRLTTDSFNETKRMVLIK